MGLVAIPEISVYLAIDNPKNTTQYGGVVAAPLVGSILESILPMAGIKRQSQEQIEKELRWGLDVKYFLVDNYIGKGIKEIKQNYYYSVEIIGDGNKILAQIPEQGEKIREGGTIYLYT